MENGEVARLLSETGDLLELVGGNPFKVRAYRQAAQVVDTLPTPVAELASAGRLSAVPTIGRRLAEHIGQMLASGDFDEHERLEAAGSVRRRRETVGDLDLLVATLDPRPVVRAFTKAKDVAAVLASRPPDRTGRLRPGSGPRRGAEDEGA